MIFEGRKGKIDYKADTGERSPAAQRICALCGGRVVRSYRTGILHRFCFVCRYLRMIYGPNIGVRRIK